MLLYIDGLTGDDLNPGTPAQPLKTVIEAEFRIPAVLTEDVLLVVVAAGAYVLPTFRRRLYFGGQVYVYATPTTTILPSIAALIGSNAAVIKSQGLVVDQFTDYWVHILTGAAAGDYRLIKSTTTTDIVPVRNFSAAIVADDTYEILDALVQLDAASQPLLHGPAYTQGSVTLPFEPGLNFENFVIVNGARASCAGRVAFWRCKVGPTMLAALTSTMTQILSGVDGSLGVLGAYGPQRVYGGSVTARLGAGLVYGAGAHEPEGGALLGYVNAPNGLFLRNAVFTQIMGGNLRGAHITCEGQNTFVTFGGDGTAQPLLTTGNATGVLRVWKGAYCTLARANVLGLGTIGIAIEAGGQLDIVGPAAFVQITGYSYAIWSRYGGGRVYIRESQPSVTVTGPPESSFKYAAGALPATSNIASWVLGDVLIASPDDGSRITRIG